MAYISKEEIVGELEGYEIVPYLTDEQLFRIVMDINCNPMNKPDNSMAQKVNTFIHHVWENTDLCEEYTIEEQCPQRFEGIPDNGKTHDAVEAIYKKAFAEGIEYAIQWIFADIDYYFGK